MASFSCDMVGDVKLSDKSSGAGSGGGTQGTFPPPHEIEKIVVEK